jgi:hypothetical protein
MVVGALQDRLKILEDEILRLAKLASQSSDQIQQDNYWQLAQDLQREARELRSEISRISEATTLLSGKNGEYQ